MAKKTIVTLVDDTDGTEIADGKGETVTFGLDGATYEIDLTAKNATALRKTLEPYVSVASKVGTKTGRRGKRSNLPNPKEVREWAKQNGFPDLSDRGRIPEEVMEAWNKR